MGVKDCHGAIKIDDTTNQGRDTRRNRYRKWFQRLRVTVQETRHHVSDDTHLDVILAEDHQAGAGRQWRQGCSDQRAKVDHGQHPTTPVDDTGKPDRSARHSCQDWHRDDLSNRAHVHGIPGTRKPQNHATGRTRNFRFGGATAPLCRA